MAKIGGILALIFMAAMLLSAEPRMVQAQDMPDPPHAFLGIAMIDGLPAPPGTELTAWNADRRIGETTTTEGGEFAILVSRANGPIRFRINDRRAKEIAPKWVLGGITRDFDLSVSRETEPGIHPSTIAAIIIAVITLPTAAGLFLLLRRRS